jgi:uncharacterized protein YkwD
VNITGKGKLSGKNKILIGETSCTATITVTASSNGSSAKMDDEGIYLNEYSAEFLKLVNIEREKAGCKPLSSNKALNTAALTRAKELAIVYSANRPDGRAWHTALSENNISYNTASENMFKGYSTPKEAMTSAMNNPEVKKAILDSNFNSIGIGIEMDSKGTLYWIQELAELT